MKWLTGMARGTQNSCYTKSQNTQVYVEMTGSFYDENIAISCYNGVTVGMFKQNVKADLTQIHE